MLVLGIETSTPQASVAIGSEQGVVASALVSRGATSYNEFLLPAIRFCLDEAGLDYSNIGGVAVSLGPGLFTGMRVGVATAKALAQALSVPIAGMASLDLVAYEVRYAFYRASPGGIQRMTDYRVETPESLASGIASRRQEVLLVGNGALLYREIFDHIGPVVEVGTMSHAFPDARALVELTVPRMFREEFDSVYDLKPLYLRKSAKRIQWERVQGSRSA
jgi:tRNA threonylcarbamoyladenosine biosynthesis protein TsaB